MEAMDLGGLNWWAIIVAIVFNQVLGAAWYSSLAKPWMAEVGLTDEDMEAMKGAAGSVALADSAEGQSQFQGLMTSIPQPSKSLTFLVAIDALTERAMAAIWQPAWLIGWPTERRVAAIAANA